MYEHLLVGVASSPVGERIMNKCQIREEVAAEGIRWRSGALRSAAAFLLPLDRSTPSVSQPLITMEADPTSAEADSSAANHAKALAAGCHAGA